MKCISVHKARQFQLAYSTIDTVCKYALTCNPREMAAGTVKVPSHNEGKRLGFSTETFGFNKNSSARQRELA